MHNSPVNPVHTQPCSNTYHEPSLVIQHLQHQDSLATPKPDFAMQGKATTVLYNNDLLLIFFFPPLIVITGGMYTQYGCLYFSPFLLLDTLVFSQPSETEAAQPFMSSNDVEDRSYAKQGCL